MPLRRSAILVLVALAGWSAIAARNAEAVPPPASYSCTPTPGDCTGWHTTSVVLRWFAPTAVDTNNCPVAETLAAEGVTNWDCGVTDDMVTWVWARATVSIDKTAPIVTAATPGRGPDANGWYRAPVAVAFSGSDATSGIGSCTTATYSTPDSRTASVTGTCADVAGNGSAPSAFPLRYDATGPNVTSGKPGRKPDHGPWYRRPVTWRFGGADALSGLDECPPVVYGGPDGRAARVIGACRDKAGNVSTRRFSFHYDATPPARPEVRAVPRDRAVRLHIAAGPDARSIAIRRAPGRGGTRDSTIYRGRPKSFTDAHARNGTRYRYTVFARDRAANRSRRTVTAVPGPRLLEPPDGAVLSAPPLLRWTPVRDADYFNVQLRRDRHKVLSRWPARARLQLQPSWRFEGRVQQLDPGHYTWDVWAGFGPRSAVRYGPRIGRGSFVIPEPR